MAANINNPSRRVTPVVEGRTHTEDSASVDKNNSGTVVTYTASGSTKKVFNILLSAEGYARWEISYGGSLKRVLHTNPSKPSEEVSINISLLSGQSVSVVGYNENTSTGLMNMYGSVEHQI